MPPSSEPLSSEDGASYEASGYHLVRSFFEPEELGEWIRLDYLIAWQNFGDLPHEATLAPQRRFIDKVSAGFV